MFFKNIYYNLVFLISSFLSVQNVSVKQAKSDHEELIEIIENIKSKAQTEKSVLKKAIK